MFLIQYFTVLVEQFAMSLSLSFAQYKNVNISKTNKDNPKRKMAVFSVLKSLSNISSNYFFTSSALNVTIVLQPVLSRFQIRTTSILEEYEIKQVSQYSCRHCIVLLC